MKNFDEKIRDKLFDAEMPVSAGVWEAIEQNLDRKDRRPRMWFLLLSLLIGLPMIYFSYYYSQKQNQSEYIEDLGPVAFNDDYDSRVLNEGLERRYFSITENLDYLPTLSSSFIQPSKSILESKNLSFQIASGNKKKEINVRNKISSLQKFETELSELNSIAESNIRLPRLFSNGAECPDFKRKWPGAYAYSQLGMSYPFQSLNSEGSEMSTLISEREMTESGMPSFSFDAGLGYDFSNGLFVQGGLMFNQINVRFLHRQEDIINTTTSIIIDTIFNSRGEVIAINKDTSVIQEIGVRELSANNSFKMIDIPVSFGYSYPISDKIHLRASAGLIFNLRTTSKGYMVDSDGEPFDYSGRSEEFFKTKWGLSYTGSLDLESQLNEKVSFNAGLNMRYFSRNVNVADNPVEQRFYSIGLVAGIKYRI